MTRHRRLALFSLLTIAAATASADPVDLNAPGYGWSFAQDPAVLAGDWTDGQTRTVRAGDYQLQFQDLQCQRRSTIQRDTTYLLTCEGLHPDYGNALWGIYMRPWSGDRWQFAVSRPAPNLEALSSGDPDERTWYTYTKSAVVVDGPGPTPVAVQSATPTPAPQPAPAPRGRRPEDMDMSEFRVDNSIPQPPPGDAVWYYTTHNRYERMEAGYDSSSRTLYVCRASDGNGGWLIGHVRGGLGRRCVVAQDGRARSRSPFDFLLHRKVEPVIGVTPAFHSPEHEARVEQLAFREDGIPMVCTAESAGGNYIGYVVHGEGCHIGVDRDEVVVPRDYNVLVRTR